MAEEDVMAQDEISNFKFLIRRHCGGVEPIKYLNRETGDRSKSSKFTAKDFSAGPTEIRWES